MEKVLSLLYISIISLWSVIAKPGPRPSPYPWDWQEGEQVDYAKYNLYEEEMKKMLDQPYFARVNNKTRVKRGESAFLPCRVKHLAEDNLVTWMRLSDVTILTVGASSFTSDIRYRVMHLTRPRIQADDWTLIINTTTTMDSGKYECSVNTMPKIKHVVELEVEDPMDRVMQDSPYKVTKDTPDKEDLPVPDHAKAVISGPATHHVSHGSTVGLECRISHLASPPTALYWKKEGKVFTARDRPGISLEVEKVPGVSTTRLFISHVTTQDSGQYSCCSDIATPDHVRLVVTRASPVSALVLHNNSYQDTLTTAILLYTVATVSI